MPIITVSGMLIDHDRLLLARDAGSDEWLLPGGPLTDRDETVEDGLVRVLAERFGIDATGFDFVDTLYERRPADVVVHNVFAVTAIAGNAPEDGERHGIELRWAGLDALDEVAAPSWLHDALPAMLAGEEAPPELDPALFGIPVGTEEPAAPVIIITGPPGAGKTTVAAALCGRFERAALVETDVLRHMVVSGYASPVLGAPDPEEARVQGTLARQNSAMLARSFAVAGFTAVLADVVERRDELDEYLGLLEGLDVAFVTLLPDAATVAARDNERPEGGRMGARAAHLHHVFEANGETRGLRLDTSAWNVEQTVDALVERLPEAWVYPPPGTSLDG